MKTLKELKQIYLNSPAMLSAINTAIERYSENKIAIIVGGQPSLRKGTNIQKSVPENKIILAIIPGAKRRYKSEGYTNVVVLD